MVNPLRKVGSSNFNEEFLVFSLHQKTEDSFKLLYDNYSAVLFGLINRIVPDKEACADILQEVFGLNLSRDALRTKVKRSPQQTIRFGVVPPR